jgi:lysophospholipase L1-like esterase
MQNRKRALIGAGVAIFVALFFFLRPSPYSKVTNIASPGSSVIAFGDSLTAGYGAGDGEDYPSQLAAMTQIDVVNAGVSGDTTQSALARLERDVLSANPRLVIIGLGGNDFLRDEAIATTENNLREIVRRTQGSGAMVVILGFSFPSLNENYEEMYERVARDEGALLIPDMLDGILSDSKLKSDAIHPNAAGYELMAERVAEPLEDLVAYADRQR